MDVLINAAQKSNNKYKYSIYYTKKMTKKKYSCGIACFRFNKNVPEILLVRKRCTYSFVEFVHGSYKGTNMTNLIKLFNGMTVDEKIDILSLNFDQIWYRVWLSYSKKHSYNYARMRFYSLISPDGGVKLKKIINASDNSTNVWEIPKGRKKFKNEGDINCAIREFGEETGIKRNDYKIYPNVKRSYSYIDSNVEYINNYFMAVTRRPINIKISFSLESQIDEVCDLKWMSMEKIRLIDNESKRTERFITPFFRCIKKKNKI